MNASRHYYASITLADGVNIKESAEYLDRGDPGFTLRFYTNMLPSSHERVRKAVGSRLPRLFSLNLTERPPYARMRMPGMAREITGRWISEVPSKMV
jgi:hypothetical protein